MGEIFNFFLSVNSQMPNYPRYVFWGAIIVVLILTQVLKLPIKLFTSKIKDENLRKKVNAVIMIIPCLVGIGLSALLTIWSFEFSVQAGLFWGLTSQTLYEFATRLWQRAITDENITKEEIAEDFKQSVDSVKKAEKQFDNIIKQIKNGK